MPNNFMKKNKIGFSDMRPIDQLATIILFPFKMCVYIVAGLISLWIGSILAAAIISAPISALFFIGMCIISLAIARCVTRH
jgi:hypothetical protein